MAERSYQVSKNGDHRTLVYEDCGVFHWHVQLRDGSVEHRPLRIDACKEFAIDTLPFYNESRQADAVQAFDAEWLAAYRRNAPKRVSAEERAEMRAAFGPGVTVVNVITGRKTRT